MTSKEALENIKIAVEYITRLDYVDPIVRGEVKQILFDAYHKTTPEFKIIEKDLEMLEIIKKHLKYTLSVPKTNDTYIVLNYEKESAEKIEEFFENEEQRDR